MGTSDTTYGSPGFARSLGHTIKVLRTDRALERKDLADRAGISYSHLAAIEAGQKQPSPQALTALATALGLATHELLASVDYRRSREQGSGSDPWWLSGDAAGSPPPVRAAPAPVAARQQFPGDGYDTAGFADFLKEISDLAAMMGPKQRAVLLDLARKLASGRR